MILRIIRKVIDIHSQVSHQAYMIHCVCNNINTQKLDSAAACGARTPACVLKHHGKKFNCGQCITSIAERLETLRAAETAVLLQAAE